MDNSDPTDNHNNKPLAEMLRKEEEDKGECPVDIYYFAQHPQHNPTLIHSTVPRHKNNNNHDHGISSTTAAAAAASTTSASVHYYPKVNRKYSSPSDTPPTQSPLRTPRRDNNDDDGDQNDDDKEVDPPSAEERLTAPARLKWYQRGPLRLLWYRPHSNTTTTKTTTEVQQLRSIWRPRHARTAEEGIRRDIVTPGQSVASSKQQRQPRTTTTKARQLSSVLAKANGSIERTSRHYVARTIAGLLHALAEEVADLEVDVESRRSTPWRRNQVDAVRIQFSRLGFKPLRMGGHGSLEQHQQRAAWRRDNDDNLALLYRNWKDYFAALRSNRSDGSSNGAAAFQQQQQQQVPGPQPSITLTADEAFDRIDVDQSGYLDREELIQALLLAARSSILDGSSSGGSNSTTISILGDSDSERIILQDLASDLFELYDLNGDGVVDRKEYKNMVEDMAALRKAEARSRSEAGTSNKNNSVNTTVGIESWMDKATHLLFQNRTWPWSSTVEAYSANAVAFFDKIVKRDTDSSAEGSDTRNTTRMETAIDAESSIDTQELVELTSETVDELKTVGSIVFSDLRMDLRQLVFGGIPVIKRISGPLILEPFRATMTGSFNREDIMNSVLLDMGLKRLVMRVVRKRVGGLRDLLEGAVFRGRSWKTFGGEGGPKVDITELTNVEFDEKNKLIITGRARVRPRPGAAIIEQAFKVRTSIGPGMDGRSIRLEEPELALVAECPESWETA